MRELLDLIYFERVIFIYQFLLLSLIDERKFNAKQYAILAQTPPHQKVLILQIKREPSPHPLSKHREKIQHHQLGIPPNFPYQLACFKIRKEG